jgi:hypothetical protein
MAAKKKGDASVPLTVASCQVRKFLFLITEYPLFLILEVMFQ